MNERIKELAIISELVHEYNNELLACWREDIDLTEYLEKFARLIVVECIGIHDAINNGNLHMGVDDYRTALLKHFGDE
jgi:hypothetical protein